MSSARRFVVPLVFTAFVSGCGGGGGDATSTGAVATEAPVFPLRAAYQSAVSAGAIDNFNLSGTCTGTATSTSSPTSVATFEGVTGFSSAQTVTVRFNACPLPNSSISGTAYYDGSYSPIGASFPGMVYQKFIALPSGIPATAKVGDSSDYVTQIRYSDSTKTAVMGRTVQSYVVEADSTAQTAVANLITKEYDPSGALVLTQQARYRIDALGAAVLLTIDQSGANSLHLVWTRVSSGVGGLAYTPVPSNPPVAKPVATALTSAGTEVLLLGDDSSDADGDALTYSWTLTSKPNGSATSLSSSTGMRSSIIVDAPGIYVATLTVNDGKLSSAPVSVTVTATDPCCLLEREPNDSALNGNIRPLGVINSGGLASPTDVDWYYVSVNHVGMIQVSFDLATNSGVWNVSVRDPNGNVLSTRNIAPPGLTYEVPLVSPGVMSVVVQPTSVSQYSASLYRVRLYLKP